MIGYACRKAGVPYPDFDQTKEWMLGLAEVAEEVTNERGQSARDYDSDHEIADSEVPYMTHKLWLIWTDLQLYSWHFQFDITAEIDENTLERLPQMACYEVAMNVIQNW